MDSKNVFDTREHVLGVNLIMAPKYKQKTSNVFFIFVKNGYFYKDLAPFPAKRFVWFLNSQKAFLCTFSFLEIVFGGQKTQYRLFQWYLTVQYEALEIAKKLRFRGIFKNWWFSWKNEQAKRDFICT